MKPASVCLALLLPSAASVELRAASAPAFRQVQIDSNIEIGYGIAVADVDGDKKPDIILADKRQIVWYRNPTWQKFVIAENLTKLDNVCIAVSDIHHNGKAEIAVGAGWNPSDTVNSGAVFYLIAPADRTQKWEAVELLHEPTVHRMRWMNNSVGLSELVVVPLHGRGNQNGEGAGVKILSYQMPADLHRQWRTEVINDSFHLTHNFDRTKWNRQAEDELLLAAKEGVFHIVTESGARKAIQLVGNAPGENEFAGAGEVRAGRVSLLATIEPMHGNKVVAYSPPLAGAKGALWTRKVLDTSLKEGHALACADLAGNGKEQIVAGWRVKNSEGKVGIKIYSPPEKTGEDWQQSLLDDNTMACEDLCVADLDGDGKLDMVASGRATKNVKIYFNVTK